MNKHILLVDDDPQLVALMAVALERAGWRAEAATSLAEAKQRMGPFDAVVADTRLPNGDGLELEAHFAGTPFVSIAGGVSGGLTKPFTVAQLQTAVREAIARK